MRRTSLLLVFAAALAAGPGLAAGRMDNETLQRSFVEAMQRLESGDLERAETILRSVLKGASTPRVKLELARALFLRGKYREAKALFEEVMTRTDTPWRVRDNIAHFVRQIEERVGYLKLGSTLISDSNPRNLPPQKEVTIGNLQLTPTEAPRKMTGSRHTVQGWLPVNRPFRGGGYLNASLSDYSGEDSDRLTADLGVLKELSDDGRVRAKAGFELGMAGGRRLYQFPYLGFDSVLSQSESSRVTAEAKVGRIDVPDAGYLDATAATAAAAWRKTLSPAASASFRGTVEVSDANEHPYSYHGWELSPGIDLFQQRSLFLIGARAAVGARSYHGKDPLFGERRSDTRYRLEVSLGNKRWRWQDRYVSLLASFERTDSSIGFYDYRKFNVSLVLE